MSTRDRILKRLRDATPPFPDAPDAPKHPLPVTILTAQEADDYAALVARFRAELERLTGVVHEAADPEVAIETVLGVLRAEKAESVLVWENLPLPGLPEALTAHGITPLIPSSRGAGRQEATRALDPIPVGITGADAAFATTGTLALVTKDGQGRIPSLVPPVHIALLKRSRLYPRLEDWLYVEGRQALAESRSVAFVTGPSRTADIEMTPILGVHGPGKVHVVVFEA